MVTNAYVGLRRRQWLPAHVGVQHRTAVRATVTHVRHVAECRTTRQTSVVLRRQTNVPDYGHRNGTERHRQRHAYRANVYPTP